MNTIELIQEAFNGHNIKYRIVELQSGILTLQFYG
jgi:hypothetical protein